MEGHYIDIPGPEKTILEKIQKLTTKEFVEKIAEKYPKELYVTHRIFAVIARKKQQ